MSGGGESLFDGDDTGLYTLEPLNGGNEMGL